MGRNDIRHTSARDLPKLPIVGTLCGFAPWIVYWVLVGNVSFAIAALTALAVAVVSLAMARVNGMSWQTLEIGAIGTFSVVTVATFALSQSFVARWILPLSIVGLLVVVLIAVLTGKPFVPEPPAAGPGNDPTRSELLGQMNTRVTWVWVAALTGMAVSSAIPPIVAGDSEQLGSRSPLSIIGTWAIPFALFGAAACVSRLLEDRVTARLANPETVRRTTFVAFRELAIDELHYLAREKAAREVSAGMEAYDVQLGGVGVSLTGDESRESWPATYKVRARR